MIYQPKIKLAKIQLFLAMISVLVGCTSNGNKTQNSYNKQYQKGTYGYDAAFFAKNKIETIELTDVATKAAVLVVPAYQGRVMTSSVNGNEGISYGWINYTFIEAGKQNGQFNPFGGEERIWLGPEGGQFSIYFKQGAEQVFTNWVVPKEIDTEPFEVALQSKDSVLFRKEFVLTNASGAQMPVGIERSIKLLNKQKTEDCIGMPINEEISLVAYETVNTLINKGNTEWTEKTGALSIWMLSMFNPSPSGVVFVPFKTDNSRDLGTIVNDEYFGKVPAERLLVKNGILLFKVDGKHRSKIGITPKRAQPFAGGYDPVNKVLTILWYDAPETQSKYVNSKWGTQTDPFSGDVVNSYNDGPVDDGSIMGPFYEIESSSPAAFLKPGEKITHTQRIYHLTGNEALLSKVTEKLFNISISEITGAFRAP
jgi:hypothetical protein